MLLKKYEAHIFAVNKNNINLNEDSEESDDEEEEGEGKKLKETKVFKSSKEGSWKPTPYERMLHGNLHRYYIFLILIYIYFYNLNY